MSFTAHQSASLEPLGERGEADSGETFNIERSTLNNQGHGLLRCREANADRQT